MAHIHVESCKAGSRARRSCALLCVNMQQREHSRYSALKEVEMKPYGTYGLKRNLCRSYRGAQHTSEMHYCN